MKQFFLIIILMSVLFSCCKVAEENNSLFQLENVESKMGKMSELLTSVEYIPLETNDSCLLEALSKQLYNKGYVYASSNGEIMKFNKQGKFVGKLSKLGNAPFEYASIVDYDIVHRNGTTEIWVAHPNGISRYSAETFEFLDLMTLEYPVMHLKYVSDETIVLQVSSDNTFCLCDINGNIRNEFMEKDPANLSHGLLQFISIHDDVYCILAGTNEAVRYNAALDKLEIVNHTAGSDKLLTRERNREYMNRYGYLKQPSEVAKEFTSVVTFREKMGDTLLFLRSPEYEYLYVKKTVGWDSYQLYPKATIENDLLPGVPQRYLLSLASCDGDDCFIQSIPAAVLDGVEINGKIIREEDNPVIMRYLINN